MQINLLHKVLNFVLNYKFINLNKTYFDYKILQDKLWYIYHKHYKLNMEVSLLQIIITKKLTKTACSSRVVVKNVNREILQFYKEYFINLYQMKALQIK